MPSPRDTVRRLLAVEGRAAATDAERRAALLLADALRGQGRDARVEAAWVRPQRAPALALHAVLAAAGSVLAALVPIAGLAVLVAALLLLAGELTGRAPVLRALLPRRATQNVVSEPRRVRARTRLVIAAAIDAPRTGAVFRDPWARLRLGPAALVALVAILVAFAIARVAGADGQALGIAQLVPSALLLGACAALVDVALSPAAPGANADGSAVGVALALAEALDAARPRHLDVEVVLAGAGDAPQAGMREYVERRSAWRPEEVVVLAIRACGGGTPRWWTSEGHLVGLRLHPRLAELAGAAAGDIALKAAPARGGTSAALPARVAGWPAISIGALDARGRAPHARTADDTLEHLGARSMRATLELAVALVARIDAEVGARPPRPATPAPPRARRPWRPARRRQRSAASSTK